MQTKPLIYGISGFILGGLVVSIAATALNKPAIEANNEMTMSQMTISLKNKTGDDYDKSFIENMINHHQSAIDMAKLSATNAKHDEIKQLSNDIINAQEKEIIEMQQWHTNWGYTTTTMPMNHSMY